jgi:hypothetical protein
MVPFGQTIQSTVPIASFAKWDGFPVPEGAIGLVAAFWNPVAADKVKAQFQVRILQ